MTPRSLKISFTAKGWRIGLLLLLLCGPWVIGVIATVTFVAGRLGR